MYTGGLDGKCYKDEYGKYETEQECKMNTKPVANKELYYEIGMYDPMLFYDAAPHERVDLIKRLTGDKVKESDSRTVIEMLSCETLAKACSPEYTSYKDRYPGVLEFMRNRFGHQDNPVVQTFMNGISSDNEKDKVDFLSCIIEDNEDYYELMGEDVIYACNVLSDQEGDAKIEDFKLVGRENAAIKALLHLNQHLTEELIELFEIEKIFEPSHTEDYSNYEDETFFNEKECLLGLINTYVYGNYRKNKTYSNHNFPRDKSKMILRRVNGKLWLPRAKYIILETYHNGNNIRHLNNLTFITTLNLLYPEKIPEYDEPDIFNDINTEDDYDDDYGYLYY